MRSKSNNCYEYVLIGGNFLLPKNAPNAPTYDCGDNFVTAIQRCNLLFQVSAFDVDNENKLREKLALSSQDAGINVNVDCMDYASLETVLREFQNLGPHHRPLVLSPLAEFLHSECTRYRRDYISVEKSWAQQSPLQCLIRCVTPRGMMSTADNTWTKVPMMERHRSLILTRGKAHEGNKHKIEMVLPAHRVFGKLRHEPQSLYLVIGPGDELLCGSDCMAGYGNDSTRGSEADMLVKCRILNQARDKIVYDQQYTSMFFIAPQQWTDQAVAEVMASKCRQYTQCDDLAPLRIMDVAVLRLATLPATSGGLMQKHDQPNSVVIRHYDFYPGTWFYLSFPYSAMDQITLRQDRKGATPLPVKGDQLNRDQLPADADEPVQTYSFSKLEPKKFPPAHTPGSSQDDPPPLKRKLPTELTETQKPASRKVKANKLSIAEPIPPPTSRQVASAGRRTGTPVKVRGVIADES